MKKTDYKFIENEGKKIQIIKKEIFDSFNETILGLGEIKTKSKPINALCVIFDLEGFTTFCKQIDPQLAVPEYLNEFLKWIFEEIKNQLTAKKFDQGYKTWTDIPFLTKYLGDGVLFLWDTENMTEPNILNVVVCMYNICVQYTKIFLPRISKDIISPPIKLRCGIARGAVYSVGNGNDYVGPCINMASRLQKLNSLSFCFSRRGFNTKLFPEKTKNLITIKKVEIRGIGNEELVCLMKEEYEHLSDNDKSKFIDV